MTRVVLAWCLRGTYMVAVYCILPEMLLIRARSSYLACHSHSYLHKVLFWLKRLIQARQARPDGYLKYLSSAPIKTANYVPRESHHVEFPK